MASIFTYDPDPPRINSPWSVSGVELEDASGPDLDDQVDEIEGQNTSFTAALQPKLQSTFATRIQAEPQEGPIEYKLHLLLRPRHSLCSSTTGVFVPGSYHSKSASSTPRSVSEASLAVSIPPAGSNSTRQHRLEQLTTQLLWRLQQSSPHHATSANNLILPSLPETNIPIQPPDRPARLLSGLEESRGALYEIGVSDDGALIGLTMDEMKESLNNLSAMAASLGCTVQVLRLIHVGSCEWLEPPLQDCMDSTIRADKLYVAEAHVKPDLHIIQQKVDANGDESNSKSPSGSNDICDSLALPNDLGTFPEPAKEQLRISFTGATTCGKSSLLGTLSTSTLDSGRGKSRLSLLKHRHEIASGVTSSVVQELIGYRDSRERANASTQVVNYATENVASWTDIHQACDPGRLAVITDSAGHPRYRRTIVRGLVGWRPHWTFLCIAANVDQDANDSNSMTLIDDEETSSFSANAQMSMAQLDLCLKLNVPLVVVVTKFDLATKSGFRSVLSLLLTRLKNAGRNPEVLSNPGVTITEADLQTISKEETSNILRIIPTMKKQPYEVVPIVFTSAVNGTGISRLHALLRYLPVIHTSPDRRSTAPGSQRGPDQESTSVFHIEDIFNLATNGIENQNSTALMSMQTGSVVGGSLAAGSISIGDELWVGPFSDTAHPNGMRNLVDEAQTSTSEPSSGFLTPRSFTEALVKVTSSASLRSPPAENEWLRVKVMSVRNLRMPVHKLQVDQVGTIGIVALSATNYGQPLPIRKGMVAIAGTRPKSSHTFTADFHINEASSIVVGTMVVIYSASTRASAKVVAVALQNSRSESSPPEEHASNLYSYEGEIEDDFEFKFKFENDEDESNRSRFQNNETSRLVDRKFSIGSSTSEGHESSSNESILVTFQLITHREWLTQGAKVLVMPGGGPALRIGTERGVKGFGGLEGYVGRIVETFG